MDSLSDDEKRMIDAITKSEVKKYASEYLSIGFAVKELREFRGWSMRDLGRRAGVSASAICRIEAAEDWNMTIQNVDRIAHALGLSIGDLMNYQPTKREICPRCGGNGWIISQEKE